MTTQPWQQIRRPWMLGLVATAALMTAGTATYSIQQLGSKPAPAVEALPPIVPTKVTALGRLEPEGEVITLAAPIALDGDRVADLKVKEGQMVQKGQVIAVLDARDRFETEKLQAQQLLEIAKAKLAQVRAGAKTGEIQAQDSTIRRLEAEVAGTVQTQEATLKRLESQLTNARSEYIRFQQLYAEKAISASLMDSKRLAMETAAAEVAEAIATRDRLRSTLSAQIEEADATRNSIAEVRPVDIQAAERGVEAADGLVKRAEVNLEQAYIRAPQAGRVLKIHTQTGEKLSKDGVVDLGQTAQMLAVAEVYQTDIGKIQVGQAATVTGQAIDGELSGTVVQIGMAVKRQNVFANEPGENIDRRIVEVKIRLNPASSQKVAKLTNLQVQTAIAVQ
jgi:HlyD family secretion protein